MDGQTFIAYADRLKRQARDPEFIKFLDHAVSLAQKQAPTHGKFDRATYQRELMRKRRAAARDINVRSQGAKD